MLEARHMDVSNDFSTLLSTASEAEREARRIFDSGGFLTVDEARTRFQGFARSSTQRGLLNRSLPGVLFSLSEGAAPDASLINLERFIQAVEDRDALYRFLAEH